MGFGFSMPTRSSYLTKMGTYISLFLGLSANLTVNYFLSDEDFIESKASPSAIVTCVLYYLCLISCPSDSCASNSWPSLSFCFSVSILSIQVLISLRFSSESWPDYDELSDIDYKTNFWLFVIKNLSTLESLSLSKASNINEFDSMRTISRCESICALAFL